MRRSPLDVWINEPKQIHHFWDERAEAFVEFKDNWFVKNEVFEIDVLLFECNGYNYQSQSNLNVFEKKGAFINAIEIFCHW